MVSDRYPLRSVRHSDESRRVDYSSITTVQKKRLFAAAQTKCVSFLAKSLFSVLLQYYHSVRVFAGQDPACVWVGWVTPDYHYYSNNFNLSKNRTVTVTLGDERGRVHER